METGDANATPHSAFSREDPFYQPQSVEERLELVSAKAAHLQVVVNESHKRKYKDITIK